MTKYRVFTFNLALTTSFLLGALSLNAQEVDTIVRKEIKLSDSEEELGQSVREWRAFLPRGESWVPLGTFSYGALHRLEISCLGNSANSSGVLEFSRAWGASNSIVCHRLDNHSYQSRFKVYHFPAGDLGASTGIAIKFTGVQPSHSVNTLVVKHTSVEGKWIDDEPTSETLEALTDADLVVGAISHFSGLSDYDGPKRGIHFNKRAYFKAPVEIEGSQVLTEEASARFVSRGGVSGGALMEFGEGSQASGQSAFAIGENSRATSNIHGIAVALGDNAAADGGSVALGAGSYANQKAFAANGGRASSFRSVAIGSGSEAASNWTTAIGHNAKVYASGGLALGEGATVESTAARSTVIGYGSSSSAPNAFVAGRGSEALVGGDYSVVMGFGAKAEAPYSFVTGQGAKTNRGASNAVILATHGRSSYPDETVLGKYNKVPEPPASSFNQPLVTVGNGWGSSSDSRHNALEILQNGKMTIRNGWWKELNPLEVPQSEDDQEAGNVALVVEGHSVLRGRVTIEVAQGDIPMGIYGGN